MMSAECGQRKMLARSLLTLRPVRGAARPGGLLTVQQQQRALATSAATRDEFMATFPSVVDGVLEDCRRFDLPDSTVAWLDHLVKYTVPGGKLNRGLVVTRGLEALAGGKPVEGRALYEAQVLGWCVEFLQAAFLVADDIMDSSVVRRGQPCYYKLPQVGLVAVNDALLLESFVYRILKREFREHPAYVEIFELFQEIIFCTELGQLLDTTAPARSRAEVEERFTPDYYRKIVHHKTADYSFFLPVACSTVLHGGVGESTTGELRALCREMGEYFQARDDYLDCFGDPAVIGKVGTDIEQRKISWCAVSALSAASAAERDFLSDLFVVPDDDQRPSAEQVAEVKALYRSLKVPEEWETYEDERVEAINSGIKAMGKGEGAALVPALEFLLAKIHKRTK